MGQPPHLHRFAPPQTSKSSSMTKSNATSPRYCYSKEYHADAHCRASSETTPEIERRKSPYSYRPQQKSPSPRQDINRIKKPQKDGVRKFSATVEDAVDREYLSPKCEPDN